MRGKDVRPSLACERLETRDTPSAGALDTAFGSAGKVLDTHLAGPARAVAVQPDGRIIAAGSTRDSAGRSVAAVARYNADGTPDTTFDTDGFRTVSFGTRPGTFAAVSVQADGKLLLAGDDGRLARVVRLNADGSLDTTFDTDGMNQVSLGTSGGTFSAADAVVTAEGKFVVAGTYTPDTSAGTRAALERFNADGTRDTTFGTGGVTLTGAAAGGLTASAMALQADGKIVVAGSQTYGTNYFFALERYTTAGRLDASFDRDGRVTTSFPQNTSAVALQILSTGHIVVAGTGFEVARYTANGALDRTFGSAGKARLNPGGTSRASAVIVESDGKVIVAGNTNQGSNPDNAALVRLHGNGQTDLSFGNRGVLVSDLGGSERVDAVALTAEGRLLTVGASAPNANGTNFALARFNTGYAKAATTTTLTASSTSPTFGQIVTLTARVTAPTGARPSGQIVFKVGDAVLGRANLNASGEAVLNTVGLPGGTHQVTANYAGTAVLAPSASAAVTMTVARARVVVGVAAQVPSAVYGQPVQIGAKVTVMGRPSARVTGSIMFMAGNTFLGTAVIGTDRTARFTLTSLPPGRYAIRAIYTGDTNALPTAAPTTATLTIMKAPTAATLAVTGNLTVSGQPLTLTAQVRAPRSGLLPAGRVTFRDGVTVLGRAQLDATGRASINLPRGLARGNHTLKVTYEGNGGFLAATSPAATLSLTV